MKEHLKKLTETAPLGTRDIQLHRQETQLGLIASFLGPYWDRKVDAPINWCRLQDSDWESYLKDWWEITIENLHEGGFEAAATRYVQRNDFHERGQRAIVTNGIHALGFGENSPLKDLGAFTITNTPEGHFNIAGYHMNGPGARAAMERGKSMNLPPVYECFDNTKYPQGDPEFFKSWAFSIVAEFERKKNK